MKKVRVGFIGLGSFCSFQHLPNAARSEYMEIHALCDLSPDILAERKAQYNPAYVTADYKKLLADDHIDLVVIATKQDTHSELSAEALQAGKWVYCEKPLCEDDDQARTILEAERNARGRLAIGYNRRFSPPVQAAKELISRQEGPVFYTHRTVGHALKTAMIYYADREQLVFEGTHMFDLANYLIGDYPVAVFSSGDVYNSSYTIVEYGNGNRFCFHLGNNGSTLLYKESIELFRGCASITIDDFCDIRVRGIPGEYDRVYPRHLGRMSDIAELGADAVEMVTMAAYQRFLTQGKMQIEEGWDKLPMESVRRVGCSIDVNEVLARNGMSEILDNKSFALTVADKGWHQALEHFALGILNNTPTVNANGLDGVMTYLTARCAVESIRTGRRVEIQDACNKLGMYGVPLMDSRQAMLVDSSPVAVY